ncbi:MAG: ThiF family adenylyltransferase [Candidatus Heimdallarchaeota archaeon]|nr:ThiF family adenylyltransferase [Candidatus Heimdallarchaeota archaeon]
MEEKEISRLDRQLRLPGWNQKALKDSKVIIAGVGGLGTEIAKNLAMAGVGTIHLVDMDTIEYSNLNRQILFINAIEGEPKAEAAAKMLRRINPFGEYIPHFKALQEVDPRIYEEVDLMIAGLDSVNARVELNRRAVQLKKPLIDGGTANYSGHVYSYIPDKNSCLACDPMREREREDLAACTLVGIPRKRHHCLLKGQLFFESENGRLPDAKIRSEVEMVMNYANSLIEEHFPDENTFSIDDVVKQIDFHEPAIITINAVIASLQSQDALRILHHIKGTELGLLPLDYTIYNGLASNFFQFKKPKNEKCTTCGPNAAPLFSIAVPLSATLDTILLMLKKHGFEFDSELPPIIWKIESRDLIDIEPQQTIKEANIRHLETLMINGFEKVPKRETDTIYLRIKHKAFA